MASAKKSLNPIPLTMRGKKRYVKFRLFCEQQLVERGVWESISGSFSGLFGGAGIAEQRLWLVKWFSEGNEGVVRCSLKELERVKAGLLFISSVADFPVIPIIVRVSGSMKKLRGKDLPKQKV